MGLNGNNLLWRIQPEFGLWSTVELHFSALVVRLSGGGKSVSHLGWRVRTPHNERELRGVVKSVHINAY